MKLITLLFTASLLFACATQAPSMDRPSTYYSSVEQAEETSNLFGKSETNLSDEEIERILNYRLKLPKSNRIAVLRMSENNYWRFYSNDFNEVTESISKNFIGELTNSERIYDASFLPSLLVPDVRTIPVLREAAARFQADLLLIYRTKCHSYNKYRFLDSNMARVSCSVESVLLDIRTGIVPFTMLASSEFDAEKSSDDLNFSETVHKAELNAISKGLIEVAQALKGFVERSEIR